MILARDVLEAIGGFDERFFMYCEEADLCLRVREAGWSVLFAPEFEFVHIGGASTRQRADEMYGELMRAQVLLLAKHRGPATGERARRLVVHAMRVRELLRGGSGRSRYTGARTALSRDEQLGCEP